MSNEYMVIVPIAGAVTVTVEAENESQAKDKAMAASFDVALSSNDGVELVELDTLEKIVQGNVCYAPQWEVEIEEL